MRDDVGRLIDRFAERRVLVVGDAILDRYLEGDSLRFCREAPVPNVGIARLVDHAGGAANTALNARALGAHVDFLSVIGGDAEGQSLCALLLHHGVRVESIVRDPGR